MIGNIKKFDRQSGVGVVATGFGHEYDFLITPTMPDFEINAVVRFAEAVIAINVQPLAYNDSTNGRS